MRASLHVYPIVVVAALWFPHSVVAAPVLVQTNTAESGGNDVSITASFAVAPTAGNLLIAMAGNRSGTTVSTIPAGWSNAVQDPGSTPGHLVIYKIADVAEPLDVTITYTSGTRLGLHVYEYAGIAGAVLREVATNAGSGSSLPSASVTTTRINELVLAGFVINTNTQFNSWSNSFTERNDFQNSGATSFQSTYSAADFVAASPGSYSTTASTGSGAAWKGHIVRFSSGSKISGTVFEDVNYGGGAGRTIAASSGIVRPGARVELYDGGGAFVTATVTDGAGSYLFGGLVPGTYYVRVVVGTVSSSRTGYTPSAAPVQTYRTDASGGAAAPVTNQVGGTNPALVDPGNGGPGTVMNTTTYEFTAGLLGTAQSVAPVVVSATAASAAKMTNPRR